MKDQLKKEAKDLLHQLDKHSSAAHGNLNHTDANKHHHDAKEILNQLDSKATAMSGDSKTYIFDALSSLLGGAHKEVDVYLQSNHGAIDGVTRAKHKALNLIALGLVELL